MKINFFLLLFIGLLKSPEAIALDITQQIQHPTYFDNPATRPVRAQADELLQQGEQQFALGHADKAVETGLQANELYHSIGDMKSQGVTYDLLASAYIKLNNLQSADDALRRRIGIARDNQDFQTEIFALNNLATLLLQEGEFNAAEKTIKEALIVARSVNNIEGQGLSLSNFCLVANKSADYAQAVLLCEKSLIFRRQIGDSIGEANTLNNLGDAYLGIKDYQNTIGAYGAAMQLAKINFDRINQLRAIDGLITAHSQVKRYERVRELLDERLALGNFLQNPNEKLKYLAISAQISEQMGNYAKARDFYAQATSLAHQLDDLKQETLFAYKFQELRKR